MVWASAGTIWLTALGCSASIPVWNGMWKLNESKSNIPGPSFSLTILPTGEYHSDNGTYSYNFRCDGKEYTTRPNRTISCTQSSASEMDTTATGDGKKFAAHWELSADGKTLTVKTNSTGTDAPVKATERVYLRTSGSSGFVGGWQDTKRLASIPQLVLTLNKQALHIALSGSGQYMDPPLNGTDAPCHGPFVPQGLTLAIRPNGPREFLTLRKMDGKIVNQGSLRLSADGHTLIEEYWPPSRPDERATLVYEKQ
jgi:hypothetical protein